MLLSSALAFLGELQNRNELDYDEGVNNYSLTVIVTDRGRPSRNLTHTVIITVADINDCVPDFGILTSVVELRLDEEQDNGGYMRLMYVLVTIIMLQEHW